MGSFGSGTLIQRRWGKRPAMITTAKSEISAIALIALGLSACTSPFAQSPNYDPSPKNTAGTITLSDPKLYSRETLINERAEDRDWINGLIKDSEDPAKVKFTPDLIRETEQISAFSASLGLKFDPTAALNYQHATETGDIQQQIDVLKLQTQLEQLKRDAELMRAKLPDQAAPVNADLGKLGPGTVADASSAITAPSVTELNSRIDALLASLAGRLDKEGVVPKAANVSVNPLDDFRDRAAYRDMLKSARNAAALDESHDANASLLLRLNFQAMVVPDPKLPRSLGAIQVKVRPPVEEPGEQLAFLDRWLRFENLDMSERNGGGVFKQDGEIAKLAESGWFDVVTIGATEVLLPNLQDAEGRIFEAKTLLDRALWDDTNETTRHDAVTAILSDPSKLAGLIRGLCGNNQAGSNADRDDVDLYAQISFDRIQSYKYHVLRQDVGMRIGQPAPIGRDIQNRLSYARSFLGSLKTKLGGTPECAAYIEARDPVAKPFQWSVVTRGDLGFNATDVRIYDIGPREQVEQVSTLARSANSLSLAASLAASAPGSGIAANAAASYSKQAMGRAAALERVPTAVGYSVAGKQTFGWVLGPRATIDARGRIEVQQLLKPYDLSVDLSVPSWWNELRLEVQKTWAPSPGRLAAGDLQSTDTAKSNAHSTLTPQSYEISVPLFHRDADYRVLTHLLVGKGDRPVNITQVEGVVNACSKVWILVRGTNLWRAQSVYVLGQKITPDQFSILPDMSGIEVAVSAITLKKDLQTDDTLTIRIVTPLGSDEKSILYRGEPSGDDCKAPKSDKPADPKALTFTTVTPVLDFVAPSNFQIQVTGKNLQKIDKVTLHGQAGKLVVAPDGTSLTVDFTPADTSSVPRGDNIDLLFLAKGEQAEARKVRIRRNDGD